MSADAERAVLASILYRPDTIMTVRDSVSADVFASQTNRTIYAAMLATADAGDAPDLVNVSAILERDGHDAAASLLADLYAEPVTAFYLPSYIETLLTEARRRAVIAGATKVIEAVRHDPTVDVAGLLQRIAVDLPAYGQSSGPRALADIVPELRERFAQQRAGTWTERVTTTGFPTLDKALAGGFRPGELIVLAGRPGMGKTAMGLALALHAAQQAGPALIFSLEMPGVSIVERAIADAAGLPMETIRAKQITEQQHRLITTVLDRIERWPVHIDDRSGLTTEQVAARAQRFAAEHRCALIVADYLEIMGDTNAKSEERRVGEISLRMKNLARSLNLPVVLLAQVSREVERDRPPVPKLSHLRYSGSIEANADIVLMLYRNDYYVEQDRADEDESKADTCDVLIRKQRNGSPGTVTMGFRADTMTFSDPTAMHDPWRMTA